MDISAPKPMRPAAPAAEAIQPMREAKRLSP